MRIYRNQLTVLLALILVIIVTGSNVLASGDNFEPYLVLSGSSRASGNIDFDVTVGSWAEVKIE